jgi:hypothetical protein
MYNTGYLSEKLLVEGTRQEVYVWGYIVMSLQPHISLLINATHLTGLRAVIFVAEEECKSFHDDILGAVPLVINCSRSGGSVFMVLDAKNMKPDITMD